MPPIPTVSQLLATPEPAELGPTPRAGVQSEAQVNAALVESFAGSGLTAERQELIRALLLLWHDHLDAAHVIAQRIENADGAFVHGIMHRREPDYGNAQYWFRRVGQHPVFSDIARRAALALESDGDLRRRLLSDGHWNPMAFIDACEAAEQVGSKSADREQLRAIQRGEFEALLDWFQNSE